MDFDSKKKDKEKSYINIIIGGEQIGIFGKIVNAKVINNKKNIKFKNKFDNIVLLVLSFILLKELIR